MSGHTPGKWGDGNEALCVKIDRERPWASTVFRKNHDGCEANALVLMTFGATVDEAVANARLCAAAPDLLETLVNLLAHPGTHHDRCISHDTVGCDCDYSEVAKAARAAIALATGGSPNDA